MGVITLLTGLQAPFITGQAHLVGKGSQRGEEVLQDGAFVRRMQDSLNKNERFPRIILFHFIFLLWERTRETRETLAFQTFQTMRSYMDGPPKKSIPFKPPVPPTGGMTGRRGKTSQQTEGLTSKDRDSPRITPTKRPTDQQLDPKPSTYRAVSKHDTTRSIMGSNMSLSQPFFCFLNPGDDGGALGQFTIAYSSSDLRVVAV